MQHSFDGFFTILLPWIWEYYGHYGNNQIMAITRCEALVLKVSEREGMKKAAYSTMRKPQPGRRLVQSSLCLGLHPV